MKRQWTRRQFQLQGFDTPAFRETQPRLYFRAPPSVDPPALNGVRCICKTLLSSLCRYDYCLGIIMSYIPCGGIFHDGQDARSGDQTTGPCIRPCQEKMLLCVGRRSRSSSQSWAGAENSDVAAIKFGNADFRRTPEVLDEGWLSCRDWPCRQPSHLS